MKKVLIEITAFNFFPFFFSIFTSFLQSLFRKYAITVFCPQKIPILNAHFQVEMKIRDEFHKSNP